MKSAIKEVEMDIYEIECSKTKCCHDPPGRAAPRAVKTANYDVISVTAKHDHHHESSDASPKVVVL